MPDFRHRLTRAQQRQYDRSNQIGAIRLNASPRLRLAAIHLMESLAGADQKRTQLLSQAICDEVCAALRVRSPRVKVEGVRRSNRNGELHGLFSTGPTQGEKIQVWMFTAKRRQAVAFKTFLRTLVHEICHHLDYALLRLGESFHTDGFFKRESSLVRQILEALPERRAESSNSGPMRDFALTGLVYGGMDRYGGRRERRDVPGKGPRLSWRESS
jgi:sulfite reductase alpha subunit-like flavoprotein